MYNLPYGVCLTRNLTGYIIYNLTIYNVQFAIRGVPNKKSNRISNSSFLTPNS